MRNDNHSKGRRICSYIVNFILALAGFIIAIIEVTKNNSDPVIVAGGIAVIMAANWMFWTGKPIRKM